MAPFTGNGVAIKVPSKVRNETQVLIDRMLMSASSTSSSTSSSQEESEPGKSSDDGDKKRMQQFTERGTGVGGAGGYADSSMSTLDRSHYQSLPLNGTRRVTVQFGRMKIVVPWKESDSTVGQLAEAALVRYKRARGMANEECVRVLRLECASDGGILDMDDVLEEVFDLNYDQILAITDEASGSATPTYTPIQKNQQHHYAQPLPYSRKLEGPSTPVASAFGSVSVNHQAHRSASPYNVGYARSNNRDFPPQKERRDSVVEVNGFENAPPPGLRVSTPKERVAEELHDEHRPILRSSLRTEASGNRTDETTPTRQPRVTLSPEVETRLAQQENEEQKSEKRRHYERNPGRFNRGSDRKSRINDALLEARERIVEQQEANEDAKAPRRTRGKIEEGSDDTTIITFPLVDDKLESDDARQMGIELNAVFDEILNMPSTSSPKLIAVQVMKIDEGGRVAKDGRIKVGDCIKEIDGRPVREMSIIRARAWIRELPANRDVTLTVTRSLESFLEQEAEEKAAAESKPILSALQQANTQYIGHTAVVELIKSANGFGFTVTSRETSKGERLFYIGTVKPYGVALGHLKTGDRLLEINGESTGQWTQQQIVEKLKETMVGEKIKFLVSRVSQSTSSGNTSTSSENKETEGILKKDEKKEEAQKIPLPALLTPPASRDIPSSRFDLNIPVNGTGSAGLGVSLKARVSKRSNGSKEDCGIFIKNVMHGGAAFKQGHLQENDRIVGVEDVNLEQMSNTDASHALAKKLKEIGAAGRPCVRLTVVRTNDDHPGAISRDSSRITVDASSPAPSSRMSSNTAPNSLLQSPQTRATSSSGVESSHSRQSSSSSSVPVSSKQNERDSIVSDTTRLDESEMPDSDPFDREAPGRKSLSEKRGLGAAADPQHIKLYQGIKHNRQNSAPTSSTQKRSKSQPRSISQRNYRSPLKAIDIPQVPPASTMPHHHLSVDESDMLNRRSQSMESINRPVESILRGTGQVTQNSSSKVQFMQRAAPDQHPFPPGTALMRLKSEDSRARDKSRRKSVGNKMRNFFGFGSKSRDTSPEKSPVQLTSVERPRPVNEERGLKNMVVVPPPPPPPPHQGPRRGSGSGGVYVDYGEPYGMIPQYPHNSASGYESYADSELYDRYAAHRYNPRGGIDDDEYIYRQQSSSSLNPSSYVNYGLPTTHAYHVDARLPPPAGGSVTTASMRRAYPIDYDDDTTYQHITPAARYRQGGSSGRGDYHHMFNSWFAYSGGGAVGAAPLLKSAYGSSPVRIAAATAIDRGESFADASTDRRGRSTSSGALSTAGPSGGHQPAKEKYADARSGKQFNVPRRSPPTLAPAPLRTDMRARVDPPARRVNSGAETTGRIIVFPSTRFPIAASSMRVSSTAKPLSNSVHLRPVPNNNNNSPSANERISLRARKKLHREAVTRSEFFLPYSNENIRLFNSLLPPSTSSIMTTTPTSNEHTVIPISRKF
ncbi:unnamed protein product [Caenorhabditis sp. 36 PRJEB53466]|nr:unnamed protein product [Caenorhabditis sp. 36 PRJEB53466]